MSKDKCSYLLELKWQTYLVGAKVSNNLSW